MNPYHLNSSTSASSRGFTLIEIMVTLVLVGILLAGLVELFVSTKRNSAATNELSRLQENGRIAIQILTADIRRAGFIGGNTKPNELTGTLGVADPNAPNAITCATGAGDTTWGRKVGQPIVGLNDTSTGYDCLGTERLRGDVMTVRYSASWPTSVADMAATPGVLYLRTNVVTGRIFAGGSENNIANDVGDFSADDLALVAHSYFIGTSAHTCRGQAVPALYRMSLNKPLINGYVGKPVSEEILAGVEQLQFRYREGNTYKDADAVTDWEDVLSVQIAVLVRAECPENGFTNDRRFTMGDLAPYPAADDAFRRQMFTTVANLRSRG